MNTLFFILAIFISPAHAQQTAHSHQEGETEWAFDIAWTDAGGKPRQVQFTLPTPQITSDLAIPLKFQQGAANQEILGAIHAYIATQTQVQIQAVIGTNGALQIKGSGERSALKSAINGLKAVQKEAMAAYMETHGFIKLKGRVSPNHARHAARYAETLRPLAEALGAGTLKRRAFARRALSFVQSIPYEKGRRGADKGFRLPVSVLAKNRGDCDSKATLYLALLRAAHPKLASAMIYIPGHAFVGLGLTPRADDVQFKAAGDIWVIAEPVGPALAPLGDADKKSKERARKGKIRLRRVRG